MPLDAGFDRETGWLVDMLENARRAVQYVSGKDRAAFAADVILQDAVIRRLSIIGEAARHVSHPTRDSLPNSRGRASRP